MLILDDKLGFRSFSKYKELGRCKHFSNFPFSNFSPFSMVNWITTSSFSTSISSLSIASLVASCGSKLAFSNFFSPPALTVFLGTFGENNDKDDFFVIFSFSTFGDDVSSMNDLATLIGLRVNFGDICDSFDNFDANFDFSFFSGSDFFTFGSGFGGADGGSDGVVGVGVGGIGAGIAGCSMEDFEVGMEAAVNSSIDGAELVEVVRCGGGGGGVDVGTGGTSATAISVFADSGATFLGSVNFFNIFS